MQIHHEKKVSNMIFKPEFSYSAERKEYFHWHENIEFLYIMSDNFSILIDGVLYKPKKGDIIFIREYAVHCFMSEDKSARMRLGQVSLSVLLDGCAELKSIQPHITAEEIAKDPVFERRLMLLIELLKDVEPVLRDSTNLFAKGVFSAFYYALAEKFPDEQKKEALKKERKEFYKIIEYINQNIMKDINVTNVSQMLYIDRGKLSKVFYKYSGMSLNDYVSKIRIAKANELLDGGYSVMEAALESGFQSVRTFNNVYKTLMGMTPSQYANKKGK